MSESTRKLVGSVTLLLGLLIYVILAAAIGASLPRTMLIELPYYIVAGLLWIFPAYRIMVWMSRSESS